MGTYQQCYFFQAKLFLSGWQGRCKPVKRLAVECDSQSKIVFDSEVTWNSTAGEDRIQTCLLFQSNKGILPKMLAYTI